MNYSNPQLSETRQTAGRDSLAGFTGCFINLLFIAGFALAIVMCIALLAMIDGAWNILRTGVR